MVIINNTGKRISDIDISNLEKRIGYELPHSYRKFILEFNGGKPVPKYFIIPNWDQPYSLINDFWGMLPSAWNDLEMNIEMFKDRLPKGFVSIARDPGDNQILISLEGTTSGKIYFWDHENEPEDFTEYLEDYPNIYLLADDFDGFLNKMKHENEL